jgi:cell division transport system permease protein
MLFIKSIGRLIRQGSKDAARNFSMTFSSALSICAALLIAALMMLAAANISQFAENMESEFVVQVSLMPTVTDDQKQEIYDQLIRMEGVDSVTYSTADEELDKLIAENGDVFSQYKEANPLYDVYVVNMADGTKVQAVTDAALLLDGVAAADYGGSAILKAADIFQTVRYGAIVFVGAMLLVALFLTRTSVKMTIQSRSEEIAIMRQVGAYNWYITTPFVIMGMITGFWGAFLPALLCAAGYPLLYAMLDGIFFSDLFRMISPYPFAFWTAGIVLAAGILVGMLGSWIAVRKNLRWTR